MFNQLQPSQQSLLKLDWTDFFFFWAENRDLKINWALPSFSPSPGSLTFFFLSSELWKNRDLKINWALPSFSPSPGPPQETTLDFLPLAERQVLCWIALPFDFQVWKSAGSFIGSLEAHITTTAWPTDRTVQLQFILSEHVMVSYWSFLFLLAITVKHTGKFLWGAGSVF